MNFKQSSLLAETIEDVEEAITVMILADTDLLPACSGGEGIRLRRRIQETNIVGISSSPDDKIISYCGDTCATIEGRLTLYLESAPGTRKQRSLASSELEGYATDILQSMESAMGSDGELSSANDNIISLEYLPPSEDGIIIIADDDGTAANTGDRGNRGVSMAGREIPTYMFAFFVVLALSIIVVVTMHIMKRRIRNKYGDEYSDDEEFEFSDPEFGQNTIQRIPVRTATIINTNGRVLPNTLNPDESISTSYLSRYEEPSSLNDDGSISFMDTSGMTKKSTESTWNNSILHEVPPRPPCYSPYV